MNSSNRLLLLTIAHQSICETLEKKTPYTYMQVKEDPPEEVIHPQGVFVTLKTKHKDYTSLRGCIGNIEGNRPIYENVYQLAKESAFKDPRFPPLTMKELPSICIQISILSKLKPISSMDEVILGTHGVVYEYRLHRALFLPEVAVEQKWNTSRLFGQLCMKASLPPTHWKSGEGTFYVFTTETFEDSRNGSGSAM
ncbi:MAG: AmmeMemoRadiSam system protein A [Sphaerochaetaceae bacterium]|nr:AmmeMemoRadiSam system protein A [Sphaerochaetaceae bacterium]